MKPVTLRLGFASRREAGKAASPVRADPAAERWLAPLTLAADHLGDVPSATDRRASDKGLLSMSLDEYLGGSQERHTLIGENLGNLGRTLMAGSPEACSGFDIRRLNMLLAVLEKRAGFRLGVKDVFLNIAGGIKVDDPAIDLAVITSVLSSNLDIPVGKDVCCSGEVGLSGEIRPVSRIEQRINEASKMGFRKIYVSRFHRNISYKGTDIEVITVGKVEALVRALFS